jgi:hypothetical protein
MRTGRLALWLAGASWLALGTLACSTIFDGELGAVRCEQEGTFGPPACPETMTCVAGACTDVGVPIGSSCGPDEPCRGPWSCLDPAQFGQEEGRRCSQTCCASTECGPPQDGQVCWTPPGGAGGICWPAAELGRTSIGQGRSGDACGGGGDCRSGLCDGGRCLDGCCTDSFCPPDELCRVKTTPLAEGEAFTCGKPPTNLPPPETCNSADDCPSGKCVAVDVDIAICAKACCSSNDCGAVIVQGMKRPVACTVVDGDLRSCGALVDATSDAQVGAACSNDAECRSGWCVDDGSGAYCTDMCCNDGSCGDTSAFSCLPRPVDGAWALRCVRK